MADQPNWAEIVSAIGTTLGALVGVPAAILFLRDRQANARKALELYPQAAAEGLITVRANFTPEHAEEALVLAVRVKRPKSARFVLPEEYEERDSYGGFRFTVPETGVGHLELPLTQWTGGRMLSAQFGLIGTSAGIGAKLTFTVSAVVSKKRLLRTTNVLNPVSR